MAEYAADNAVDLGVGALGYLDVLASTGNIALGTVDADAPPGSRVK